MDGSSSNHRRTNVHATTAHSNMVAEHEQFIRSAVFRATAESLTSAEPATTARVADDVASGNPTVCCAGSGWQMRVTVYEDDHEKEILQSDGETMKKVTINEASTLVSAVPDLCHAHG